MEGLSKKDKKRQRTHDTDNSVLIEEGGVEEREGIEGINGDGKK